MYCPSKYATCVFTCLFAWRVLSNLVKGWPTVATVKTSDPDWHNPGSTSSPIFLFPSLAPCTLTSLMFVAF